jgi:hypothetical protein
MRSPILTLYHGPKLLVADTTPGRHSYAFVTTGRQQCLQSMSVSAEMPVLKRKECAWDATKQML